MLTPTAASDGTPAERPHSSGSARPQPAGRGLGAQVAEAVAEGLTAVLTGLLPDPPPKAARTCTALQHASSDGLLGTRCDISLRGQPGGWTATGRAEHVLGLPGADRILCEAVRPGGGGTVLVLLPLRGPGVARGEGKPSPLTGARWGCVRLDSVPVPDAHTVQVRPGHEQLLHDAVAGTRLRLARLVTELAADAVAAAIGYVVERPLAGGRVADRQAVRHALVEATAQVRMCDAHLNRVESRAAPSLRDAALRVAAHVAFAAPRAVETACQLHGGYGFLEEQWIARAYRDSVYTCALLGGQDQLDRATGLLPITAGPEAAAVRRTTAPVRPPDSASAFRAGVRALVRQDIAPHVPDWEANGGVTRQLFAAVGRAGVFGVRVPAREGGLGLGLADGVAFIRAVGRDAVGGVSTSLSVQTHVAVPLLQEHGTQEQKRRWLHPLLKGDLVAAVAITEPGGGSDLVNATATRAVATDEGWLLDGEKTFVTNAPIADFLIVLARTEPRAGALGMTFFLVPTDLPEVRVRRLETVGLRSSHTGRIRFTGCRLPAEAVLGRTGLAMAHLARVLPEERLAISAGMLECARRSVERTAVLPTVRSSAAARGELSGWTVRLEAAEAFLDAAVERFDGDGGGGGGVRLDADLAKTVSARLTQLIVNGCARLAGPDAFADESEPGSLLPALRDVRVLSVFGGSCETVRDTAAAEILRGAVVRRGRDPRHHLLAPRTSTALRRDDAQSRR
ncbi:acyl-CoA dehydrogenase family protein [Streptomyces sp. NPDC060028]|uniref:acyl-CoA dehydrogenase family protein n=1 Tax=Streptomyces sp. NPDC060028 TaxID=3347041 RepID=UPI0036C91206